jgi:glycosyltransferase involved in cell wall biosynthesis
MKILMLQDFFGLDQSYQENLLTQHYIRLGHKVVVIASTFETNFDYKNDNYNKKAKKIVYDYYGAKIIKLPYSINILNKIRKHAGVYQIILEEQPDIIYAHDIHLNLKEAVKYLKANYKLCRIIMDYHADFSNSANGWLSLNVLHKIIRKRFLKKYLKYISRIYPVVPASAEFLHKVYDIPENRMELLPLGCDYQASQDVKKTINIEERRREFGIKPNDLVIFTGGRLEPAKKTELIIDALKKINKDNIHIIVVGTSTNENSPYEVNLKEISINENVHFTGWLNSKEILEIMAISDLAIYPASQSVLWQQSIGMHLPLILGEWEGQSAEYLNLNNNIIIMKAKDINTEKIALYINKLEENRVLLNKMKEGAQLVAESFLDYKVICRKTLMAD